MAGLFVFCTACTDALHHRAGDMADPLWNMLDMTPEG